MSLVAGVRAALLPAAGRGEHGHIHVCGARIEGDRTEVECGDLDVAEYQGVGAEVRYCAAAEE